MSTKNNNNRPVKPIRKILKGGPLAHTYERTGYITRWEHAEGIDFSNALQLGWEVVDMRNGDGYNEVTSKNELASNYGSHTYVRPASRGSNKEMLILMEMPLELFHEYEVAHDARNKETIDQLNPDDSVGCLNIKKM